jgi:hypothetical protein
MSALSRWQLCEVDSDSGDSCYDDMETDENGPWVLYEDAQQEIARLTSAMSRENEEISQRLGKALGYPWFKDDQTTFPGATEENGVCVGDHVAASLAAEAASRIDRLQHEIGRLNKDRARLARFAASPGNLLVRAWDDGGYGFLWRSRDDTPWPRSGSEPWQDLWTAMDHPFDAARAAEAQEPR